MTWVILCSLLDHPVGDCDLADWGEDFYDLHGEALLKMICRSFLERQMIASGSCIYFATDNMDCIWPNNVRGLF